MILDQEEKTRRTTLEPPSPRPQDRDPFNNNPKHADHSQPTARFRLMSVLDYAGSNAIKGVSGIVRS